MSDEIHADMDMCNEAIYLVKDCIANDAVWRNHVVGDSAEKVIVALRQLRKELAEAYKEICGE